MITCQKCKKEFPFLVIVNGVRRNLSSRKFCLECSPFGQRNTSVLSAPRPSTVDSLSSEDFSALVKASKSRKDICRKMGLNPSGSSYQILNRRLRKDNVDTSHFELGYTATSVRYELSLEQVMTKDSSYNTNNLKRRLLKAGKLKNQCAICDMLPTWNGQSIIFQLDHINGVRNDHRLENLQIICPNCHSQTITFSGRNHKKRGFG